MKSPTEVLPSQLYTVNPDILTHFKNETNCYKKGVKLFDLRMRIYARCNDCDVRLTAVYIAELVGWSC